MKTTVTIEVPVGREALVRRVLALSEELDQLALSAPDGTVLEACESAVLAGGRDLQVQVLEAAIRRRVDAAEKKGRQSAGVGAAGGKKTAGRKTGNSSVPSA